MSAVPDPVLRLTVVQSAPSRDAPEANLEHARAAIRAHGERDLVVFPELSLTGYALGHRTRESARGRSELPPRVPGDGPPAVVGYVERGEDQLVYNAAAVLHRGRGIAHHRKTYLPTYGMFDEGRFFAPGGEAPRPFVLPGGWTCGLLICEELWHPALPWLLGVGGVDVVIVPAAAPGRGHPGGTGEGAPLFASTARWELLARATALTNGVFVVLANRVGVEEGITFAGGSLVVDPRGEVLARAPEAEPSELGVELERASIARARDPYAHLRDDDPDLVLRALAHLRAAPSRREGKEP